MWVNTLTNDFTKKYMLLTDEEIGNGETYILDKLMDDGWNEFCNVHHTYKAAQNFMKEFHPEYSLLKYEVIPINFKTAKEFVDQYHRHHIAPQGYKFAVAATDGKQLIGVAIAGRPISRYRDDGETLEITRCCAKAGYKNLCSLLYARVVKIASTMGYKKIITYTLESESGISLIASGFKFAGINDGGSWNTKKRPRKDKAPTCKKKIWVRKLAG